MIIMKNTKQISDLKKAQQFAFRLWLNEALEKNKREAYKREKSARQEKYEQMFAN